MSQPVKIEFIALDSLAGAPPQQAGARALVIFSGADGKFAEATLKFLGPEGEALVRRAAVAAKFKGKASTALDIIAPGSLAADRLLVIGAGGPQADKNTEPKDAAAVKPAPQSPTDYANLGGFVAGKLGRGAVATVVFDPPQAPETPAAAAAEFALGVRLRDYRFDLYKTKKKDDVDENGQTDIAIAVADPAAARAQHYEAVAQGVLTARSLVNEPPNVLYPEEFANRAKELEKLGVEVEILDEPALKSLGMGALLGVGQGSERESRVVIMRWRGAETGSGEAQPVAQPIAFVGKGVTFDTGGISIKPAAGMEDMKGDMAGAACVVGLIEALATRKAKVDAIGAIGLVENMPGANAQRPGDIVTSMSGQTIEIVNTDAEGRLVLGDVLWYVQDRFKPKFVIDLATLTGAVLVALGQEHAGLFANDEDLAEKLLAAGKATGEKLWRLPLAPAYDKLIDSKFADMKNTGGRHAGSITAAQFLQRFVNGAPWAHLDIAGTGMGSPSSEVNQSWASGFGVRLLDRLVADNYEGEA